MAFATEAEREQTNQHLIKLQQMVFHIIQKKQAAMEAAQEQEKQLNLMGALTSLTGQQQPAAATSQNPQQ